MATRENRPNVLIFCVDQMRADHMWCAGNSIVKTPNLDSLAARGTVFERSYCNNPICMPARATMFTGLLPRDHGLRVNGQALCKDIPTLPGILAETGYRTHSAGKLHLTPYVPMIDPPEPEKYPECLPYWNEDILTEFPTPYYGFQTVDFVGGHTSFVFGEYMNWLRARGGNPELVKPQEPLPPQSNTPSCYEMHLPEELHYNRYISDSVIDLIESTSPQANDPFFVWCSFPDPHSPLAPPKPYFQMYGRSAIPLPPRREGEADDLPKFYRKIFSGDLLHEGQSRWKFTSDEQIREMIALTYGMITHVDNEIGRILRTLEVNGLMDNTLIVFLSDHGDMMGDHNLFQKGPYTFQGCIRIPTIVAAPGMPGGRVCRALISQVDLLPSVLDFCGVPLPGSDWLAKETPFQWGQITDLPLRPGKSWLPLLDDSNTQKIHDQIVIENENPATGYHIRCMVTEKYRITVYPGTGDGELFDLEADPEELANLWYSSDYETLKTELIKKLLDAYSDHTPYYPIPPWNS